MELFSNQSFLEDLDKIWELRYWIPNPNNLEYSNRECLQTIDMSLSIFSWCLYAYIVNGQ